MADGSKRVGERFGHHVDAAAGESTATRKAGRSLVGWVPKVPSRRSLRIAVGAAVVLAVLYVGLMLAYYLDGAGGTYNADRYDTTAPTGGVLVALTTRTVDPVAQTMTVDLRIQLDKTLDSNGYDFGQQSPVRPLVITILTFDRTDPLDEFDFTYPAGQPIRGQPVALSFTGYIRDWPLDRYRSTVEVLATSGQTALPVDVSMSGSVQNWSLSADPTNPGAPADSKTRFLALEFTRSLGTVLFGAAVLLVLITLPILGLVIAIGGYRGRRPLPPAFLGWLAALLFATVPLRNFLPGNPPAGSWVDVAVVLWVLIGLIVALVFAVRVWWRDNAPAETTQPTPKTEKRPR